MLGWYCVIQVFDGLSSWTFLAKQEAYFKALRRDTSIFSQRRKTLCLEKAKNVLLQHTQKMELEHKRSQSRLRSFVNIIVLKICFSCLHFFTFCYPSWATPCHVAFSDYYESILFHVGQRIRNFFKFAVIVTQ